MPPAKRTHKPAAPAPISVRLPITLGQFLKLAQLAASGGEAKILVAQGLVRVNGVTEQRRGHRLAPGDVVQVGAASAQVLSERNEAPEAATLTDARRQNPAGATPPRRTRHSGF